MKTLILLIAILGFTTLNAQNFKEVNSDISDVIVYLNGAQITRKANVTIPAGKTDLLFKGLTARLNQNSIQVGSEKNITILSVNHSYDYLEKASTGESIAKLTRQRDALHDSIETNKYTRKVYTNEREMLLQNQRIGGDQTGVNVDELIKATKFFRSHLKEIESLIFKLNLEIKEMNLRLDDLNRQLSELNAQKRRPTSIVKITVKVDKPVTSRMNIIYTVQQASWDPVYDIRVKNTNEPLNLIYKARVHQNSDEGWNNVKLTLSTGNPSISNYKPELQKWIINFKPSPPPPPLKVTGALNIVEDDAELDEELEFSEDTEVEFSDKGKRPMRLAAKSLGRENISIEQQQTTTSFKIDIPYTIPSDNQGYDVSVIDYDIPVDYQFAAVPKLSPHIYLMALATDWHELNLLPGGANIYYQQTYQGKTYLDPYTSKDTLNLSIGRDPGIIVKRELQKEYSSKSMFGNNTKETRAWKITVRNTKSTKASVLVEDQYPISANSDIKVELEESSGAKVNTVTGILNWKLDLDPNETKELLMVYSVRYPKGQDVVIE
jgi:uncharacterized protein (TIGR02231 family)